MVSELDILLVLSNYVSRGMIHNDYVDPALFGFGFAYSNLLAAFPNDLREMS
jgi:hypothetical protein